MGEVQIKKMLEEFRTNKKIIEELIASYDINTILDVAFKEKMYDIILELFKPINIDGEIKIYFDIFSCFSMEELTNFIERFDLSKNEKDNIYKSIFNIDIEKMRMMRIGNTLPRSISGWGHPIESINDVIYYAEPACLESMIYLFNNNIITTFNDTECVYGEKNENGECRIRINYESLSNDNKEIANQLISMNVAKFVDNELCYNEKVKAISIEVPCNKNDFVGDVSDRLKEIIQTFNKQPMLFGVYSREEIIIKMKEDIEECVYNDWYLFSEKRARAHFMELIDNGQLQEKADGDIKIEDGRKFSIDDFTEKLVSSDGFLQKYINYNNMYYDPIEDKYWKEKSLYDRYINSKSLSEEKTL